MEIPVWRNHHALPCILPYRPWGAPVRWNLILAAVAMGMVGAVSPLLAPTAGPEGVGPASSDETPASAPSVSNDPRVLAILQAYGPLIDSVTFSEGDAVFSVKGRAVRFQDGRMLGDGNLAEREQFGSIFYRYPLEWLTEPPPLAEEPIYCTDFLDYLFGQTESEIRSHGQSVAFLDHRMFVNTLLVEPLQAVEREVRTAARHDQAVAKWIGNLNITYSFIDKDIAGSQSRSYHAYGLAVDLVPLSSGGKQVYWRWSRVFNREGWDRIPMARRWNPPQAVVEAFERQGFVWGGKWAHFDTIHFEYRPEILLYNRMLAEEEVLPAPRDKEGR